jgi:hypothetical protein
MSYDFESRLNRLGERKKEITSRLVCYEDGDVLIENIAANIGESEQVILDQSILELEATNRDYIIDSDDLVFKGQKIIPNEGAYIYDGTTVCQVVSKPAMPHFKYTTATNKRMRIHTKIVEQ